MLAKLLHYSAHTSQDCLELCTQYLKQGKLVAFPTETVYGLGANALNEKAVLSIFEAKGRPLTDPVIVHVVNKEDAMKLIEPSWLQNSKFVKLFDILTNEFWPGPLTIVVKSNSKIVPSCVTANTGYVGIRSPKHILARKLLEYSQLPIAAPSANRFGHVSPTKAEHVMEDLSHCNNLVILQEDNPTIEVGIESTVVKIDDTYNGLQILRRGGISKEQLQQICNVKHELSIDIRVVIVAKKQEENMVSPGQLITHYAPDIPTFIWQQQQSKECIRVTSESKEFLQSSVLIDFAQHFSKYKSDCLQYVDLSQDGSIEEASQKLFDVLRWAEKVPQAKHILLCNVELISNYKEHADALMDRMFRAASGKTIQLEEL